ncbi:hypothetical protein Y032_0048g1656 [Ancylostoma ceylanicum]|uniref:SCP domain-containing protein n=1 Tax=Ancylostoma ceylanicum TaxID=53326 RepID=A0A016UB59_9BILA|nr:hypothetical protein Y032_0048g1656 [Ancylostoma ceylanicum]
MWSSLLEKAVIVQLLLICVTEATWFGCRNTLVNDEWRQAVLDFHNNNRRTVAEGKQPTGGNAGNVMPKADKMYNLNWDCDIENNAFLSSCGGTAATIPAAYASNKASIKINKKCSSIKDETMTVLKNWWSQATAEDLSAGAVYKDQTQKEFGIMVFGETTGFACSYSSCDASNAELLCLYNKAAPNPNAQLYAEANGDVCDACPAATDPCTAYLCKPKVYALDTNAKPQPACTNKNPPDDGMTYDMQMMARDMANYYRNLIATGWAHQKSGYAPTSKAMNSLIYDCDNAGKDAKTEAAKCTAASYTPTNGYVLSSYKANYDLPREEVLRQAMVSWFGQLKKVDLDEKATYDNNVKASAPDFASLVYGGATKLGCAVGLCLREGFQVAICQIDRYAHSWRDQFKNTAAVVGDPLYTIGKTCSGCAAAGKNCHKGLPGICA